MFNEVTVIVIVDDDCFFRVKVLFNSNGFIFNLRVILIVIWVGKVEINIVG